MIENIKAINNPLTIIAIFSALAEIAGTVSLKLVSADSQHIFIWFVMLFPVLIVILFFTTLNFNPKVLYAPSDFRNDESFINVIKGVSAAEVSLTDTENALTEIKKAIDARIDGKSVTTSNESQALLHSLSKKIREVERKVDNAKTSVAEISSSTSSIPLSYIKTTRLIVRFLQAAPNKAFSVEDIAFFLRVNGNDRPYVDLPRILEDLRFSGAINAANDPETNIIYYSYRKEEQTEEEE